MESVYKKITQTVSALFIIRWGVWLLNEVGLLSPIWNWLMSSAVGRFLKGLPLWDKLESGWVLYSYWFGIPGLIVLMAVLLASWMLPEYRYRRRIIPVTPAAPPPRASRAFARVVDLENRKETVVEIEKRHQQTLDDGKTLLCYDKSSGVVSATLNGQQNELGDDWRHIGKYLLRVVVYDERQLESKA